VRAAFAVLAAALAVGCLLPQPAAEPRYFAPGVPAVADPPHGADATQPELRLRRVRSAAYLRNRMVWRNGVELGFYDLLRWTEPPARYVQQWLEDELFERCGLRRATSPKAPQLVVRLSAFDELLAPAHEAAVTLDATLLGVDGESLFERSFAARRPIASDDPKAVADALGEALTDTSGQVGDAVLEALHARRR
jgi:ABC-type uncharacterized transport system auxiliary subunit